MGVQTNLYPTLKMVMLPKCNEKNINTLCQKPYVPLFDFFLDETWSWKIKLELACVSGPKSALFTIKRPLNHYISFLL